MLVSPREELEQFIAARYKSLLWYARRWVRSDADAEDVLQDACLKAFRFLPERIEGDRGLERWFYRVLSTMIYDRRRKGHVKYELPRGDLVVRSVDPLEWRMAEPVSDIGVPGEDLLQQEFIDRALADLPIAQAEAIALKIADCSEKQICARLGVNPGTVKTRVHRGQIRLRKTLGDEYLAAK